MTGKGVQTVCKAHIRPTAAALDATCYGFSCVLITPNYQETV